MTDSNNLSLNQMFKRMMGNCGSRKDNSTNDGNLIDRHDLEERQLEGHIRSLNVNPIGSSQTPDRNTYQTRSNEDVIDSTRAEVNDLLGGINEFQGTTENDMNYKYLDEMLTRCMLKLDNIECNSSADRSSRKEAIRGVNKAISILEKKLEINSDIKKLEFNLKRDET